MLDVTLSDFTLRIIVALLLGMVIGLERQYHQHPAGLRTNALVCVGAAMFVSLAGLQKDVGSPTRIASYIVSGIGFLGGGVILREGLNVRGLNTAATLWCSGAVGALTGSGFLAEGAIGTLTILFTHIILRPLVRYVEERAKVAPGDVETLYRVKVQCHPKQEAVIRTILMRHINSKPQMTVQGISATATEGCNDKTLIAEVFATGRHDPVMNDLVSRLGIEPQVTAVSWERTR
jgi:putative Mg2+ transporter-C (MgtC) family protein